MKKNSKRFSASRGAERLVPILLILLVAGIVITFGIILLSVLGFTPGV